MKEIRIAFALIIMCISATAYSKIYRDAAQVREFKRVTICPSTLKYSRNCPGYIVDHIKALACGGDDRPYNMQYQTVAEAKAKDKWELKECGK